MSHLVHAIVRVDPFTLTSESPLMQRHTDDACEANNQRRDDDWDHLWTDVGGEG